MAVHKKPANAASNAAEAETSPQKRDPAEAGQKKTEAQSDKKIGQEPVVVSDVVTETTETIEVIEGADPLSDFKEKMVEEESLMSDNVQKKNYMWPILLIFIITILLLTGVFLYKSEINTNGKVNVVTLSPTPTTVPEPTKTIDLTKYEIEILNGSEVSGEASRQKTNLTAEGFMILSIGNADNSDYTDTIIKAKAEVDKDFIAKLKTVLSNSFTVGETEVLSEDSSVPVVVIIGTKK